MKEKLRILGIDDGPFTFKDKNADMVGVLCRGPIYIEAIMRDEIEVDGKDSTQRIVDMVRKSGYQEQIFAILLDGGALGGFNVFDIKKINRLLSVPVITITHKLPDFQAIERALKIHFTDWKDRLSIMSRGSIEEVTINGITAYIKREGLDLDETSGILRKSTVLGAIPEPLRLAHMVAAVLGKKITSGRP